MFSKITNFVAGTGFLLTAIAGFLGLVEPTNASIYGMVGVVGVWVVIATASVERVEERDK